MVPSAQSHAVPHIVLVHFEPRETWGLALGSFAAGIGAVVILSLDVGRAHGTSVFAGIASAAASMTMLAMWVRRRCRMLRFRQALSHGKAEVPSLPLKVSALVNGRLLESSRPLMRSYRWDYAKARESLERAGIPPEAMCIVDDRLRDLVATIEARTDLLEPELARESPNAPRTIKLLVIGMALLVLAVISAGTVPSIGVPLLFVGGIVALASLRQWWLAGRGVMTKAGRAMVGPGFLLVDEEAWRASECLTIVRSSRDGDLVIALVGPPGTHVIRYLSEPDSAFRDFWQRWMHPNPRPEFIDGLRTRSPLPSPSDW